MKKPDKKTKSTAVVRATFPAMPIEGLIHLIRDQKVMLDSDLADLYGVETKALNRAVKRNPARFPDDLMFQLTEQEAEALRCQTGTSKGRGGRRYLPYVFTEHGVVMLSSVLNSERAIQVNLLIVRTFVRLRQLVTAHKDLGARIEKLERGHDKTASVIEILVEDIDNLSNEIQRIKNPPIGKKRPIGFGHKY